MDGARLAFGLGPHDLVRHGAVVAAGIDRKSLALDQTGCHADGNNALKDMAKDVALLANMRRVRPYRGENSGPGKECCGELDTQTRNYSIDQ